MWKKRFTLNDNFTGWHYQSSSMSIIVISLIVSITGLLLMFLNLPMFGKTPAGNRLQRVKLSANFRNGKFQNIHLTPDLTEGVSYYAVMKEFFFHRNKRGKPANPIPSKKTNLQTLHPKDDVLVWFGHSSYFIQVDGVKILVDPVLSGAASPVKSTTRSFKGTDIYKASEIPEIDFLFITHDHWDHLDYATIMELKPRIKNIICGLGTGAHFEHWGFNTNDIIENDWNDEILLDNGFVVNTVSARHFSGRGLKRNTSLWVSFILKTAGMKIFLGGDSGYDDHFAATGAKHGPFDLAILECGQYDKSWKYIHMMPEEVVQAAKDLKALTLFPVHWGKFLLGNHAWDEPITRLAALSKVNGQPLITPMIGEAVNLKEMKSFTAWWENLR